MFSCRSFVTLAPTTGIGNSAGSPVLARSAIESLKYGPSGFIEVRDFWVRWQEYLLRPFEKLTDLHFTFFTY